MSALSDLVTQAAAVNLTPVKASGPADSAATGYLLVPSNLAGYLIHAAGGSSLAALAASITAGTPIVHGPSAQEVARPTDVVSG
jgi:hypothetical protein